jgi:hypothetical protein
MEIHIKETADDVFQQNKIRWQRYVRKKILFNMLYIGIGALLILFSLLDSTKNTSFWNLTTSFGMSSIFLAIIYLLHLLQLRGKYFAKTQRFVDRLKRYSDEISITVTDSSILYKDSQTTFEVKWTSFSNYKIYKDYLIVDDYGEVLSGIMINIKDLTAEEQVTLKTFLNNLFRLN